MQQRDKLDEMFSQQESFMRLLQKKRNFPQFPVDLETKEGQKFCKSIVYEIMGELFESVQHLKNSKDHRITNVSKSRLTRAFGLRPGLNAMTLTKRTSALA